MIAKSQYSLDGVAIFGGDNDTKAYFMIYFDERGISRKYEIIMEGNQLKRQRDDPKFSQRATMAPSEDGKKIIGQGEMSREKAAWEKDLSLTYVRLS